ncbi:hypothetical protein QQ008_10910 [Fulvivirgaceae bacterium BMA10]|uniref:Uncharacterized protein n=1 Tax=Splendidivirga corallicola TaxID=3051826 RepID=A0ABT8KMD0_9BACT|nr:hypothetical protein [Fulvivirgaceae bacterium BMA10]
MTANSKKIPESVRIWKLRFSLIIVFIVSVLIVGILNIIPVRSTQVLLELDLDEFVAEGSAEFKLVNLQADYLNIAMLDTLDVPAQQYLVGNQENNLRPFTKLAPFEPLRLSPRSDVWNVSASSEYLGLNLQIHANSSLRFFSKSTSNGDFRMELLGGDLNGHVDTGDDVLLHCNNCLLSDDPERVQIVKAMMLWEELKFRSRNGKMQLRAELSNNTKDIVIKNIEADSLHFIKDLDQETTIIGGTITFPELDGVSVILRDGDYLTAHPKNSFRIRNIKINENITLLVQGEVVEIKTGIPDYMYSRMPTWYEWISTNRKTQFLTSSIVGLMTVILGILYKLKFLEK